MTNEIMHYEGVIDWTSGDPVVVYKEMLTKEVIAELPLVAISMPYKRTDEEIFFGVDNDFEGLTNAEVMNIRIAREAARGGQWAIKALQDRILGKPKQQIEVHKKTENYHEFVERVTEEENKTIEADAYVF